MKCGLTGFTRHSFIASTLAIAAAAVLVAGCSTLDGTGTGRFEPVKILAVNDLHLLDEASTAYPRKVIESMNREGADLVLVCGDLATDGKRSELELAKGLLEELKAPFYVVPGNHDAQYSGEQAEVVFGEIFRLESANQYFVEKGVHFIGIDPGFGKNFRKGSVRPEVMAWIKKVLKKIPGDAPIVVFCHYPFASAVKSRLQNADEVLSLFKGKKLLAVISGHHHANTEQLKDGILMTTTACSSSTRGNHDRTTAKGFRVFRIDGNMQITSEFVEVEPELKDL